ncbi:MAG: transcriptional repressor [Ignavibacteriales bacterium]|nr:transcriptional repressor [Ignavibacteriales bacterium]MBK7980671.1 transcriptional repressor [Ignavibacteriota bacterium]
MENLFSILKENGAKLTSPRKTILEKLYYSVKPLTLKEIYDECNNIDFASVYRSLKLFYEIGIVEEINFADNKIRFELKNRKHHHHVICSECGEIKELPVCLLSEIEKITDYKITKHNFEFMGICPKCKK